MSKHNYTQYSKMNESESEVTQNNVFVEPELTVTEETANAAEIKMEVNDTETVQETDEDITGIVTGCAKLNVRATPDLFADVVCILDVGAEVVIDLAKSYNDWYGVTTATGIDGYCMSKYVDVSL